MKQTQMKRTITPMKDSKDFFTRDQIRKMISVASERDGILLNILYYSFRRITEVLSTRVKDINFEENYIDFVILKKKHLCYSCLKNKKEKRMIFNEKKAIYECPECKGSLSVIPLREPIGMPKSIMKEIKTYLKKNSLGQDDFLFGKEQPISRQRVDQIIKKLAEKSGIEWEGDIHKPHIHATRSGGLVLASKNVETAEDLKILQERAKHSSIEITSSYLRFNRKREKKLLKKMMGVE